MVEAFCQDHSNDDDKSCNYAHSDTHLLAPCESVIVHSGYLGVFIFLRPTTFLGLQSEALIANSDDSSLDVSLVD